mmetsp:Transcript_9665/g.18782  ORF Transcript_9665/g.18782 Transcript_9665/m.18782 type:complete len:252 (-) Transcript_9665:1682-2437(-)
MPFVFILLCSLLFFSFLPISVLRLRVLLLLQGFAGFFSFLVSRTSRNPTLVFCTLSFCLSLAGLFTFLHLLPRGRFSVLSCCFRCCLLEDLLALLRLTFLPALRVTLPGPSAHCVTGSGGSRGSVFPLVPLRVLIFLAGQRLGCLALLLLLHTASCVLSLLPLLLRLFLNLRRGELSSLHSLASVRSQLKAGRALAAVLKVFWDADTACVTMGTGLSVGRHALPACVTVSVLCVDFLSTGKTVPVLLRLSE